MELKSAIDRGFEMFKAFPGAVLVDVRTPEEYAQGHIPGSINIPLQNIFRVEQEIADPQTPLFVYCQSGARSRRAAVFFEKLGFTDVHNIGAVTGYSGELVR